MQGKAIIKFFTIAALLVVTYQFMLWFPTNSTEQKADDYATAMVANETNLNIKQERKDSFRNAYLDSVSSETVFEVPLLKKYTYQELKKQQIAWGLDLQGGMSVVMQVDLKDLIIALSNDSRDIDFRAALDEAKKAQASAQTDYVTLFVQKYEERSEKSLSRLFVVNEKLKEDVNIESRPSRLGKNVHYNS